MAHADARQHAADTTQPVPNTTGSRLEVLSRHNSVTDVVRLFHRGDCKPMPVATELLRQAIDLLAGQPAPAVLFTGAGFTWVELPGGTARRYPNDIEHPGIADAAQRTADDLRRALPPARPLVVAGLDVFAWPRGSEYGEAVGQFAAVLPADGGPARLLPKRFSTVSEEAYLRVPGTGDYPPPPACNTPRGRAVVLVCHDLNVYHPRSVAVTSREARRGWRKALTGQIETLRPALGLHLAHYVDTERNFLHGYGGWRSAVGVPLFGVSGLSDDVTPDRARELAATLLGDADGWGVVDLLERPAE